MGLPNAACYPEEIVTREDEQTMSVSLKYVNAEDVETAELMLFAELQRIGYSVRRG